MVKRADPNSPFGQTTLVHCVLWSNLHNARMMLRDTIVKPSLRRNETYRRANSPQARDK